MMTVFGFGRQGLNKYIGKLPQSFSIGFVEGTSHAVIANTVAKLTGVEPANPAAASATPQGTAKPVHHPSKKAR